MDHDDADIPPHLARAAFASFEVMVAAGTLLGYTHDPATGRIDLRLTPAMARLLRAGRWPAAEPGFVEPWLRGDYAAVRRWIEAEAAALPSD